MSVTRETLDIAQQMKSRMDSLVDATTRALVAGWADAWAEIAAEWDAAISEIVRAAADDTLTPHQILRLERAQKALMVTADRLRELSASVGEVAAEPLRLVVAESQVFTERITRSQMPNGARVSWSRVSESALDAIVARSMEQITSPRVPLSDEALNAVRSSLVRAVPSGWSPDRAAREILSRVNGAFNGGLSRAMSITRTELLDAHRTSTMRAEQANPDTVKGWQWVATLDTKTCPSCWSNHGSEHDTNEPGPQDHPQGRCTRLTLTKTWADLGFPDMDEPTSLTPDRDSAWDALTSTQQQAVLGPTRHKLLTDGDITWDDLTRKQSNSGWRDSYTATPTKDLI